MAVRSTMMDLIALVRDLIYDPSGVSQQFSNQQIQDRLDASRDDIRYELLEAAPSVVNASSTSNQAQFVYADFYSRFQWWEADVVLQGDLNGSFWKTLTPASFDSITGHWQFQLTPFVNGVAPGQIPPVYATGKVYDCNTAAADLLVFWANVLSDRFDGTFDGQNMQRSQRWKAKLAMATEYRRLAKPKLAKMVRSDLNTVLSSRKLTSLLSDEIVRTP